MNTLLEGVRAYKPGSTRCVRCFSLGWTEDPKTGDRKVCHSCLGSGAFVRMEATDEDHYEVRCNGELWDAGGPLESLVANLPVLDESDLTVWLVSDGAPRVVCVVRPGFDGENVVVYV